MKKLFPLLFLIALWCASACAQYPTTNLGLKAPTRSAANWGSDLDGDFDLLDAPLGGEQTANPSVAGSARFQGPNPWVDVSFAGARAVSAVPQTTVTCTSGSTIVTLAAAIKFQNGDGVVAYGCGATNTLATPGAPIVTPSLLSGPDTTVDVVNAPSGGSTTYSYEIVARDKNGGLTAVGTAGTTSTGWTLGTQQSAVTTLTRSHNTVTVDTSAANGAAAGGIVFITNSTDATFSGFFVIASVASATRFTYTQGMDTRAGASTSATGGTAQVYSCNHLSWTAVSGAWQYYIYGRIRGSLALLGATLPGITQFNDCGSTMSAPPKLPDFVPARPPLSASNDYLATTISSGAGTSTLTLATAASNSVTGKTIKFDDGPTLLNATTAANSSGATLHISALAPGTFYPINSHTILTNGGGLVLIQGGKLTLNETVEAGSSIKWTGELGGPSCVAPQFSWNCGQTVDVNTAYPGVVLLSPSTINYLSFFIPAQGLGVTVADGFQFNVNFEHDSFNLGSSDQMGQAVVGDSMSNAVFRYDLFSTNDSSGYGYSLTPLLLGRNDSGNVNPSGNLNCEHCYFVGRGFGLDSNPAIGGGASVTFRDTYAQALRTPLIEVGLNNGPIISVDQFVNDTSSMATLANWTGGLSARIFNVGNPSAEKSGSPGIVTGNLIYGLTMSDVGHLTGQNRETFTTAQNSSMSLPIYSLTAPAASSNYTMAGPLHFPSQHTLFWDLPTPTGLTATAAPGGTLAAGTHTYQVTAVGADGGETSPTLAVPCTTGSGHNTCNLSWTAVTGAVSYNMYRNGFREGLHIATNRLSDASYACCGVNPPSGTGTGLTTIKQNQIITPSLVLSSPLTEAISYTMTFAGPSLTANRVLHGADGAASVVVSASLVTTLATSDKVTIPGATTQSHCSLTPTNRTAATNIATTFISAKTVNQITVTHSATANMNYDVLCTVN
jgi:hypothetical protein